MPFEKQEFPADFCARRFSVIVVNRQSESKKPQDFEEYAAMVNLKLAMIRALAFMLGELDEASFTGINPDNLKEYISEILFLINNFASSMHLEGDLELFLKTFE